MSDSLVTQDALVAPSDGQAQQASGQEAQSSTVGQPSSNGQAAAESENVAKLHRLYAQKERELKQQVQASQQYIQQLTNQMREAQRNAAPDDFSRLEIDLQFERQEKAALMQRLQSIEAERQYEQGLYEAAQDIAEDFHLLTADEIAEAAKRAKANDYKAAYKLAAKLQREKEQHKQRQDDDKRDRNLPDVGGGGATTYDSKAEAEWQELVRTRDSFGQARWLRLHGGKK